MELADPGLWAFRNTLYQRLAEPMFDGVRLAQAVAVFVDEAGKEPSARRARLRQVVAFAADFYRQLLHAQCGLSLSADRELLEHVGRAMEHGPADREATSVRLDRCLDAAAQIDRNANQATLIECWMDDLARGECA
jgi:DNA polymerase-3 subunit delta'